MGHQLFLILLVFNTFVIVSETSTYSYRFNVYPVNECPMNKTEFETAARIRNCTRNTRYLCAPDKYLASLIEFCTDQNRSLYEKDNCLKLEGTGNLNHYKCVDKFISGCPTMPYYDEDIYKYPACLSINRDLKCFVAEKDCRERYSTTTDVYTKENGENGINSEGFDAYVLIVVIFLIIMLTIVGLTVIMFYKKRKIEKGKKNHLCEGEKGKSLVDKQKQMKKIPEDEMKLIDDAQANKYNVDEEIIQPIVQNEKPVGEKKQDDETFVKEMHVDGTKANDEIKVDEQTLREFLGKGELTVGHVRCILTGCTGAGKTTLLRRLENVTFEELQGIKSTEIVDVQANSFEVLEEKETIQSVDENSELPTVIFSAHEIKNKNKTTQRESSHYNTKICKEIENINNNFETEKKINSKECTEESDTSEEDSDGEGECDEETSKTRSYFPGKKPRISERNHSLQTPSEIKHGENNECGKTNNYVNENDDESYAISKIKDDVERLSKGEHFIRPRITFLDFGGQSLYYAFHQIYLSQKSYYIFVVDMTKRPDEKVHEPGMDEVHCSGFNSWKYQDYYKFWLSSIDAYGEYETPVILVGTHADKISKQASVKFFQAFIKMFDDEYPYLRRHLSHDRAFAIGFPEDGSELENLADIKKCIAKLVRDPIYNEEKIRPLWALFERILHRRKTQRIISRKSLSKVIGQLNEELRINEEEITNMLCFFHRVGILLYFKENSLNDTIILDIQWFVNAFKSIINFPVGIRENDISREKFKRTGLIYDNKLTEIWNMEENKVYSSHKKNILLYMERLGLLTRCLLENEHCYYIPSMNRTRFEDTEIDKDVKRSSILCFQFDENGQLPVFLFYGLVLKCMHIPLWSTQKVREKFCLYENAACLSFRGHTVAVCLCKFQIQVQVVVEANENIDSNILGEVQHSVEAKMLELKEDKKYDYTIGYKCQNGKLNAENDNSFIAKKMFPFSRLTCDKCIDGKKHNVDNKICWIPTERQKNEDTQYTSEANEKTDEGMVSIKQIIEACLEGNIEHFTFHLEKEIGSRHHLLMRSDNFGWNVLHVAAKGGNLTIFCKLVSENLNICQKTHSQMTVLHIASKYGHYDICKSILENKDFKELVCEKCSEGKNACHYAAEGGSVKLLQLLVDNGIDEKTITHDKLNIFHIACIYSQLEMCKFIFDTYDELVDAETNDGWTAALHAAKNGNKAFLEFLKLAKKVSLEHKSESDRNALHIACDNGHLETCKFLSETCPSLLSATDHKGRYPVHFAARSGNMKLLKYLESKTDKCMTMETTRGMNILHMACLHDHIEMCRYILDRYPDLNVKRSTNGWTTAHYIAGRGNNKGNEIEIFKMLINAEIPVEIMHLSKHGNSVLTLAIKYNVFEFAEYLFENHCNMLHIPDANNPWKTGNEHSKMLKLLHKYLDKPR